MKQISAILMICTYFNCFGAATSDDGAGALERFTQSFLHSERVQDPRNIDALRTREDPAYVAFKDSKRSVPAVVDLIAPLIQLQCDCPHGCAYTSIGTHQLFACFVAGSKLGSGRQRIAHELVQTVRSYWNLRLGDFDYTQFRQAGCKHAPYPLIPEDVNRALRILNGVRFAPNDVDIVCLDASSEGIRFLSPNAIVVPEYHSPDVMSVEIARIGRLQVNKASIIAYFKSLHGDLPAGDKRMSHNAIDYVESYCVKNLICLPRLYVREGRS